MHDERPHEPFSDVRARELNDELVRKFGIVLPSSVLVKMLGYHSPSAYRQAISRGTVPVQLFSMPNRRGRFALARDVAEFVSQRLRCAEADATSVGVDLREHQPEASKPEDRLTQSLF